MPPFFGVVMDFWPCSSNLRGFIYFSRVKGIIYFLLEILHAELICSLSNLFCFLLVPSKWEHPAAGCCVRLSSCMWHSRAEKLQPSACGALRSHIHPTGRIWDPSSGSLLCKEVWSSGTPHASNVWPQRLPLGQGCQVYMGCVSKSRFVSWKGRLVGAPELLCLLF